MLQVKEIFGPTLQGEGNFAGTPAIFIRFAGCNMWNGILKDRAKSKCPYCDTDFIDGRPLSVKDIINEVKHIARDEPSKYLIVLTGGEPLLQKEEHLTVLVLSLIDLGCRIQFETNGTKELPEFLSDRIYVSITCSPKLPYKDLVININDVSCWKILYPHPTLDFKQWKDFAKERLEESDLNCSFYLQPIEEQMPEAFSRSTGKANENIIKCVETVLKLGRPWRLSLQQHKILGLK